MKHPEPPSKPSELIRLALRDLRSVERSKKYSVNMHAWHQPLSDQVCEVCLAGAVMARSLKVPHNLGINPVELDTCLGVSAGWYAPLSALNDLRIGDLEQAALCWHECGALSGDRGIPIYDETAPKAFHTAMEALAAEYEAAGA